MFRRHYKKRSTNLAFVIFRLLLSLTIFAALIGGVYYAYREFSGFDPIKLNPKSLGLLLLSNAPREKFIVPKDMTKPSGQSGGTQSVEKPTQPKKLSFKFAVVADSHSENELLERALVQASEEKVEFIIGLGDYTEVGITQELENAKNKLMNSGIRFFVTPGDHDLWDSRNKGINPRSNFNKVFGPSYQSFEIERAKFIIIDNSDNYLGVDSTQMKWLDGELLRLRQGTHNARFVMLHEPLSHPSSERVMGKVEPKLKDQAKDLIKKFKNAGVSEVFAGDIHFFTRYAEPETKLSMTTIGALASQRNTQNPRYAIISVYEDGSYNVEDVEVK